MMKNVLLILAICGLYVFAQAQTVVAELSYSDDKPDIKEVIMCPADGSMLLCTNAADKDNNNYFLHKYDGALKEQWQKELPIAAKGKNKAVLHKIVVIGEKIYVFASEFSKGSRTFYYTYDLSGNQLSTARTQLLSVENKIPAMKMNESKGFHFTFSPNKQLLLVAYDEDGVIDDIRAYKYFVFDEDGVRYQGEITHKYNHQKMTIRDISVSDMGNIYTQCYTEANSILGKDINCRFWLHKWDCENKKATETNLDFKDSNFISSKIYIAGDETVYILGTSHPKSAKILAPSLIFAKVNSTNTEILERNDTPFSQDLTETLDDWLNNAKHSIYECSIKNIIPNDDGTFNVLVEETNTVSSLASTSFVRTSGINDMVGTGTEKDNNIILTSLPNTSFANIVISMKIDEKGKLNNYTLFKKVQITNYPEVISYVPLITQQKTFLFTTLTPQLPLVVGRLKGKYLEVSTPNLYCTELANTDNKFSIPKPIFKSLKKNEYLNTAYSEQIADNVVILFQLTTLAVGTKTFRNYYFSKVEVK